jgi:hypothetical protein
MAGDIEGVKRVRDTLDFVLKPALEGFVEANMKGRHGNRWLHYASRSAGQGPNEPLDSYGLLKTILDNWQDVFAERFDRKNSAKARRHFSTVFDARNTTALLNLPLSDAEALNYLYAMSEVAILLKAIPATQTKLKEAYEAQRRSGGQPATASATPAVAPQPKPEPVAPSLDLHSTSTADDANGKTLKPWIEVALPHQDVIENRTKQAEFAADLYAVDNGHAEGNYASAKQFFGITFLTNGLKRVLITAAQRLANAGGDPVIGLQTSFGGGKYARAFGLITRSAVMQPFEPSDSGRVHRSVPCFLRRELRETPPKRRTPRDLGYQIACRASGRSTRSAPICWSVPLQACCGEVARRPLSAMDRNCADPSFAAASE